jgi:hypothetical protein
VVAAAAATTSDRDVAGTHTAAQLAGRLPGTWAHLSQEAALEAALLVVLQVAGQQERLLHKMGKGVEATFLHM